jgi:hydrogenase maturation protein HypF
MNRARTRVRARVYGVVQGVGFRPFVHRLAQEQRLCGWVRNDAGGVVLEAEGERAALERFLAALAERAPPLASVERVRTHPLAATGERGFRILESAGAARELGAETSGTPLESSAGPGEASAGEPVALVSPDVAPCAACLAEMLDARDRRHRYPFINCTDCGPRLTIVRALPYDRERTTMAGFEMCAACRAEYEDPTSRRFHAQPNACAECGPRARLIDASGAEMRARDVDALAAACAHDATRAAVAGPPPAADAVSAAAALLAAGAIVAVKGAGGYHLACRADDERAVAELRRRKRREEKPFAVMALHADALAGLVELSRAERELMAARERPIVLARRRAGARVAASVAPGLAELGVMQPSTPLHHLLLRDVAARLGADTALVMTSGNASDEPIAFEDADALARLRGIADALLVHDRPIHARVDDSVVRAVEAPVASETPRAPAPRAGPTSAVRSSPQWMMLRRARGFAPRSMRLPLAAPPLLACGAELKSTLCVARGGRAWVSEHVGDLRDWETLRGFRECVARYEALFGVRPRVVAHDLHPDYMSSAYALEREGVELVAVQHHHAHFAAVLAEHGELGRAVGAIYDGAGLGTDGTVWGGELLAGDIARVARVGHLRPVRLPGGDAAAREPWRMACAWLATLHEDERVPPMPARIANSVDARRWEQIARLAASATASPLTTSVGRLFDAVAALCGLRTVVREEGRAAVELEAAAAAAADERRAYPLALAESDVLVMDARATIDAVTGDLDAGVPAALVSARFHNALADATARALALLAQREEVRTAVLAGGVFQNRTLLERCAAGLAREGLRVLFARELPPNDGAISYGQAAVAAALLS